MKNSYDNMSARNYRPKHQIMPAVLLCFALLDHGYTIILIGFIRCIHPCSWWNRMPFWRKIPKHCFYVLVPSLRQYSACKIPLDDMDKKWLVPNYYNILVLSLIYIYISVSVFNWFILDWCNLSWTNMSLSLMEQKVNNQNDKALWIFMIMLIRRLTDSFR